MQGINQEAGESLGLKVPELWFGLSLPFPQNGLGV